MSVIGMASLTHSNEGSSQQAFRRHSSLPKPARIIRERNDKYEVEYPPVQFVLPVQLIVVSNNIDSETTTMEHVLSWLHLNETFSTPSTMTKSQLDEADIHHALCALFACYPSRIVTKGDFSISLEVLFRTLTDLRAVWNCYRKGQLQSYVNGVNFQKKNNDTNSGPGIECNVRIVIELKHYYSGLSTLFGIPDASIGAKNVNSRSSSTVKRNNSLRLMRSTSTSLPRYQTSHSQLGQNHDVMETSEDFTRHQKLRISGDVVKRLMTPVYTSQKHKTWSSELKVTLSRETPISKNHSEQQFLTTCAHTETEAISDSEETQPSIDCPLNIQRKLSFDDPNHIDSVDFAPKQRSNQDNKDPCVNSKLCEQVSAYDEEEDHQFDCKTSQKLPVDSTISSDQSVGRETDVISPVDCDEPETDTAEDVDHRPTKYNHVASLRTLPHLKQRDQTYVNKQYFDDNDMLDSGTPVFKRTTSLPDGMPFVCGSLHLEHRHRSEESLPTLKMKNENQTWHVYTWSKDESHCNIRAISRTSQNSVLYCKSSNSNILVQTANMEKNHNSSADIQDGLAKSLPPTYDSPSIPNVSTSVDLTEPPYPWSNSLKVGNRKNETRSMPDLLQPSLEREHHLAEFASALHTTANLSVSMQPNGEFPGSLNTWSKTETLDSHSDEFYFLPNNSPALGSSSLQTLLQPSEPDKLENESPTSNIPSSPSTTEQEEVDETVVATQCSLVQCEPPEYDTESPSCIEPRDCETMESSDRYVSPCISNIKLEQKEGNINDSTRTQTSPLLNIQRNSSGSSSTDQSSNSDSWEKEEYFEHPNPGSPDSPSESEVMESCSPDSPSESEVMESCSPDSPSESEVMESCSPDSPSESEVMESCSPDSPSKSEVKESFVYKIGHEEQLKKSLMSPVRPKSLDANYIFKSSSDQRSNIPRTNRPEPLDLSNQDEKALPEFEILTHDKSPVVIRPKSLDIDRVFLPSHSYDSSPVINRIITPATPGASDDDLNIPFRRDTNFNLDTLSPRMSLPTIRRKRANQLRKIDDTHRFSLPRNLLRIGTPTAEEFEEELPPSMSASLEELAPKIGDESCYRIVYELVMTEQSYVSRLFLLNKIFFEAIARENEKHRYFSPDVLDTIFSNTPQIHSLHKDHLLPQLKKRITEWKKHDKIGDIMRKYAPMLRLYSIYVCEMDDAIEALDKWTSKSSKFNSLLKNIQKKKICGRIGLKEHMLEPVQRLPRYQLLLERYLKKLPDNSEDREDTEKALGIIKEAAQHANDFIKSREMRLRLITIGKMIDGEKIVTPTREIIKEGNIFMEGKNGLEQKRLFLFNDMLMVCTPTKKMLSGHETLKVKYKLNVERIKANDYEVDLTGTTFTVRSTTEEGVGTDVMKMHCASEDEKYAWLQELREATNEAHERSLSFRRKLEEQKSKSTGYHPKQIFKKMQGKSSPDSNSPISPIYLTTTADETEIFV